MAELTLKELQIELQAARQRRDFKAVETIILAMRSLTAKISAMRQEGLFDIDSPSWE